MTDVIMPQMGETVVEGTITRWLKQIGDHIQHDEPLLEISTDKVDAEIPAPVSGELVEIRVFEGNTVPISTVLGVIATDDQAAGTNAKTPAAEAETSASTPETSAEETTPDDLRRLKSSPVVRRIASEHDVDIRSISGTGMGGRVTKQDILEHISRRKAAEEKPLVITPPALEPPADDEALPAPTAPPPTSTAGTVADDARSRLVPMSPIRKKTAENMVRASRTAAHATTVWEIDMSHVAQLRDTHRVSYQERFGVHLTFLPFILKSTVDALKTYPILNSSVEGDSIRYHNEIRLGVAVALEHGLIVPVIRSADEKGLLGLARAVSDLAERARTRRLQLDEVQGGTFTITNPGVFGNLFGTPIIPPPQVGILAVGSIGKRPVARDDAIAVRMTAHLSLSFDHRVVDGSDADLFMADLKRRLEDFDETAL